MQQDVTSAFLAAQAEQRIIAKRAERAWIITEAELQGRFTPRPSTRARVTAALNGLGRLLGRRFAAPTAPQPVSHRKSVSTL